MPKRGKPFGRNMDKDDPHFGFHPKIRHGSLGIISKLDAAIKNTAAQDGILLNAGLPFSFRANSRTVLEAPFAFTFGTTLDELYAIAEADHERLCPNRYYDGMLVFNVIKADDPTPLRPFQAPDPYTDDWLVNISLDDMVALWLAS
jgi:hypothetical protein